MNDLHKGPSDLEQHNRTSSETGSYYISPELPWHLTSSIHEVTAGAEKGTLKWKVPWCHVMQPTVNAVYVLIRPKHQ